ncbi:MAG: hypothetical protein O7E52_24420 [Candidatus Poribacteria bacterium]|nr:hypothetical protein [Candidatus Poribacteria bacterium]
MIRKSYQIARFRYSLQTRHPSLKLVLDLLYPDCQIQTQPDTDVNYELVKDDASGFFLRQIEADQILCATETADDLYLECEWHLTMEALKASGNCLQFHAGVIEKNGSAAILPGESGSGKTTLVIGCVLSGMNCLSDEVAVIDPKTLYLHPFRRMLIVKSPTMELFPQLKENSCVEVVDEMDQCCHHIPLSSVRPNCLAEATRLSLIIFPRHTTDAKTRLERLGQAETATALIQHAFGLGDGPQLGVSALTECVRNASAYRLAYSDYAEAIGILEALMDNASFQNGGQV